MPYAAPKLSSTLQALIDKGLLDRLPITFTAYFYDQMQGWNLLFPAEKNYFERLFSLLDRSPAPEVQMLFAPIRQVEKKMGVNEKTWPPRQFSLDQVDFLNRSPHFAEWRKAVSELFQKIDPVLDAEITGNSGPRLVVVISPAELPVGPDRMWLKLEGQGKRIKVETPDDISNYLPLLLTGQPRFRRSASLADLWAEGKPASPYNVWSIETGEQLADLSRARSAVRLSYDGLREYRTRLMSEVQRIVDSEQIKGPKQLAARLKDLKPQAGEGELSEDSALAEFVRATLLSGNGTLLLNNTFVEWATVQAVRRARPSLLFTSFGIRNKVKPFSSLLIYTDQDAATPIPTQGDMLGSYVDLEVFYPYIWQEFAKYPEYRGNTGFLFVAEGMDELLAIGPPDFPVSKATGELPLTKLFAITKEWMGL